MPKVFLCDVIRNVKVRESYFVIAENDKPETIIKEIVEEKLTNIDSDVVSYEGIEQVKKIEEVNPKLMRMMSKGFRETNKRLNKIKETEKTEKK